MTLGVLALLLLLVACACALARVVAPAPSGPSGRALTRTRLLLVPRLCWFDVETRPG